jgi:hypothetical protein
VAYFYLLEFKFYKVEEYFDLFLPTIITMAFPYPAKIFVPDNNIEEVLSFYPV